MDGPLADDLYFAVHDPFTGLPRAPEGRSEVCLAAALGCELLLADQVAVLDGELAVLPRPPSADPLAQALLVRLQRRLDDRPWSVADWLAEVTPTASALVQERLLRSGRGVRLRRRRFGLVTGTAVAATEATVHELAVDRLAAYLRNAVLPQPADLVLAVLALLAEPRPDLLTGTPAARDFVLDLAPRLPDGVLTLLARAERVLGGDRLTEVVAGRMPDRMPGRMTDRMAERRAPGRAPGRRSAG